MYEHLELEHLELEHQASKKKTEKKSSSNTKQAKKALLGVRATVVKRVLKGNFESRVREIPAVSH